MYIKNLQLDLGNDPNADTPYCHLGAYAAGLPRFKAIKITYYDHKNKRLLLIEQMAELWSICD